MRLHPGEECGFAGTSMLAVAKRAKASNETLYRRYDDKVGLFTALFEDNATGVKTLLEQTLDANRAPLKTMAALGPQLCGLLTGNRAVALNRAAAAEATGELGATLTRVGRDKVLPPIVGVLDRAISAGEISGTDAADAARLWLDLLVGDLQIRRAIGAIPELGPEECARRGALALDRLGRLLPPA